MTRIMHAQEARAVQVCGCRGINKAGAVLLKAVSAAAAELATLQNLPMRGSRGRRGGERQLQSDWARLHKPAAPLTCHPC